MSLSKESIRDFVGLTRARLFDDRKNPPKPFSLDDLVGKTVVKHETIDCAEENSNEEYLHILRFSDNTCFVTSQYLVNASSEDGYIATEYFYWNGSEMLYKPDLFERPEQIAE